MYELNDNIYSHLFYVRNICLANRYVRKSQCTHLVGSVRIEVELDFHIRAICDNCDAGLAFIHVETRGNVAHKVEDLLKVGLHNAPRPVDHKHYVNLLFTYWNEQNVENISDGILYHWKMYVCIIILLDDIHDLLWNVCNVGEGNLRTCRRPVQNRQRGVKAVFGKSQVQVFHAINIYFQLIFDNC